MKELSASEISKVNGGVVPFAVMAAVYMVGQASSIYGTYKMAQMMR